MNLVFYKDDVMVIVFKSTVALLMNWVVLQLAKVTLEVPNSHWNYHNLKFRIYRATTSGGKFKYAELLYNTRP